LIFNAVSANKQLLLDDVENILTVDSVNMVHPEIKIPISVNVT